MQFDTWWSIYALNKTLFFPLYRDVNGKNSFFFVIEVQRIDITSTKENAEDLQWTVLRKYSEFYTLETRLTEFHGEFEDLNLPPKASLFTGKQLKSTLKI